MWIRRFIFFFHLSRALTRSNPLRTANLVNCRFSATESWKCELEKSLYYIFSLLSLLFFFFCVLIFYSILSDYSVDKLSGFS